MVAALTRRCSLNYSCKCNFLVDKRTFSSHQQRGDEEEAKRRDAIKGKQAGHAFDTSSCDHLTRTSHPNTSAPSKAEAC